MAGTPALTTVLVARGLASPLDLQSAPGDRSRIFVVEQTGRIRVIRDGTLQAAPFLDVSGRISTGGERGLLGLAFHPGYAQNGRFFVNYTDRNGDTHVAEFHAAPGTDTADAGSERPVLSVAQPFANHNGGGFAFGRDGQHQGTYFYADYCSHFVRSFRLEAGRPTDPRDWTATLGRGLNSPTSFGVDGDGETYIVDQDGEVYRIVPAG